MHNQVPTFGLTDVQDWLEILESLKGGLGVIMMISNHNKNGNNDHHNHTAIGRFRWFSK